ncbi:MAG: acylphosphatase [Atopobiaceae bacterium]|uniref:acylphosphatase n=1 Tax=Olsenella absiana TaxID=3115222 RepID=A0ABU7RAW6_9ACTN|nr:acylphosphatase [Olsenella sp.]MDD7364194.1 acylphosphatase [Olsenella sp.]MDY3900469.1 acylphosphatase [Atopobiaceae bacterium]
MLFRSGHTGDNDSRGGGSAGAGREKGHAGSGDAGRGGGEALRRLRLRFTGQVQGVGFRWNSQRVAREVGCTGWVRNEWDGSVRMELQGTDEQVSEFFGLFSKAYRQYPIEYTIPEKEEVPPVEDEPSFSVRY